MEIIEKIKQFALDLGVDLVGVCNIGYSPIDSVK